VIEALIKAIFATHYKELQVFNQLINQFVVVAEVSGELA
jgi:DNA mismatch repair ATPase MutS